jgi:putative endonuclease
VENRRKIGTNYERLAGKYLEAHGYQIIEYNFKCNAGEIDIIAKDQEYLVFCEVKYRKTAKAGYPMEAVSLAKQRRISKCAQYYVYKNQWHEMPCRFDVVGILGTEVQLLKNAFDFVE